MATAIEFAGVPLLCEDPGGQIQAWLDQWIPLSDLQHMSRWQYSPWKTWNVPTPNYPDPLRVKLNTWYRPVGASRWAFGLFLATNDQKQAILREIGTNNNAGSLRFRTSGLRRGWQAFCLPPRPVSTNAADDRGLWLIPLVDERYYWQFLNSDGFAMDDGTPWGSLLTALASAVGTTLYYDAISSDYGYPDPTNWNQGSWANPAVMLDAAAWSVGQRIVLMYQSAGGDLYYANVYKSCNWSTSNERRSFNYSQPSIGALQSGFIPGGELNLAAITPASVEVVFQKWANGIIIPNGYYTKRVNAGSYASYGYTPGWHQSIQTSAFADFTSGGGTPDNQAACDALATKIAADFYGQVSWVHDFNYLGSHGWIETGFDNYVEFSIGRRNETSGEYECKTRIHSVPHNLGVQSMLHSLPNTHTYGSTIEGKLDGALSAFGTATLSVWDRPFSGGSPADTGKNLTITDRLGWDGPAGAWVVCNQEGVEWRPVAISCNAVP